jgi:PhnB protein
MASVSTYLNFSRNTEEVFNFYRSVFGGEFSSNLMRFSDIPQSEGSPQLDEKDKNLIIHIELPLPGGHLLMGTDAPESMGFNLVTGNNIHISLETDTKSETIRLFKALSSGGKITMELQDMFWGGYYGSCTDKYGIQWMFNYNNKSRDLES